MAEMYLKSHALFGSQTSINSPSKAPANCVELEYIIKSMEYLFYSVSLFFYTLKTAIGAPKNFKKMKGDPAILDIIKKLPYPPNVEFESNFPASKLKTGEFRPTKEAFALMKKMLEWIPEDR